MYIIKNDELTAMIDHNGAELVSVRDKDGYEHIWTAEDVWKRHAPVLFPFVCNTKSKSYTVNGKEYALSNHGFARDSVYEVTDYGDSFVEMTLRSSEETLKNYPYRFTFVVRYSLEGNTVRCSFGVRCDDKEMYFFIGGHPGFLVPFASDKDGDFTDYDVVYEHAETIVQHLDSGDVTVADDTDTVPLTRELFKNDVFLKGEPSSSWVALRDRKTGKSVKVRYDKEGTIAVWSPYDDRANFVCLEPWAQTPVYDCDTEELTKMPHAKHLTRNGEYEFKFDIVIG
ncbi:MAG: aldose 1-epimerase family protein [Oscillospiraceae bacterium]|nr:aldose 1-epimerase family protein [Oscillospiraceae bacterium]